MDKVNLKDLQAFDKFLNDTGHKSSHMAERENELFEAFMAGRHSKRVRK